MPDRQNDWRTEIAKQVCTLVRDDRVMARFREMCVEFPREKMRDEDQRREWKQRRKNHCLKGLGTLAKCKARWKKSERLGDDREAIKRTRPKNDTEKTWVFDYYEGYLSNDDLSDVEPGSTTLVRFAVWVPPELSLLAAPKLTVPSLFGRFTGHLHSLDFGTTIEPGTASIAEKYATLAVIHDARFSERPSIDEVRHLFFENALAKAFEQDGGGWGRFTEELRSRERKARQQAVTTLPNSARASLMEWLADVEADLKIYLKAEANLERIGESASGSTVASKGNASSPQSNPGWLGKIALSIHQHTFLETNTQRYRERIKTWVERVSLGWKTPALRAFILREKPDRTEADVADQLRIARDDLGRIIIDRKNLGIGITTDAAVPLDQVSATMAAIHEKHCDCRGFGVDFWLPSEVGFKNPAVTGANEDWDNLTEAYFFKAMVEDAASLLDANRPAIEDMLASVAADLHEDSGQVSAEPESDDLKPARASVDFRSVHFHGATYTFTKMQAAIVRVLWEAKENGTPEVGGETLLESVDAQSSRLVDIFRDHLAWGTLIVDGSTKGSKRIADAQKS